MFLCIRSKNRESFGEMKVERVNFESEKSVRRSLDPFSKTWNRFRRKMLQMSFRKRVFIVG